MVRKLAYALSVTSILGNSEPVFAAGSEEIEQIIQQKGVARYSPVLQNPTKKQSKYLYRANKWTVRARDESSKYGPNSRKHAKALRKARKYWNKFLRYGGDVFVSPIADAVPIRPAASIPLPKVPDVNKSFVPGLPTLDLSDKEKGEDQEKSRSVKMRVSGDNLRVEDLRVDDQSVIPARDPSHNAGGISIKAKKVKLTVNHNHYYLRPEEQEEGQVSLRQPARSVVIPQEHQSMRRDNKPQDRSLPESQEGAQPVIIPVRKDFHEERQQFPIARVVDPVEDHEDRVIQENEEPLVLHPELIQEEPVVEPNNVIPVEGHEDLVIQQNEEPLVLHPELIPEEQVVEPNNVVPVEGHEDPVIQQNEEPLVLPPEFILEEQVVEPNNVIPNNVIPVEGHEDRVIQENEEPLLLPPELIPEEQVVELNDVMPVEGHEDPVIQQNEEPLLLHRELIPEEQVVEQNEVMPVKDHEDRAVDEVPAPQLEGLHLVLRLKAPEKEEHQDEELDDSQIFSSDLFGYDEDSVDIGEALENLKSKIDDFTVQILGLRLQSQLGSIDLSSLEDELGDIEEQLNTYGPYDEEDELDEVFSEAQLKFSELKSEVEMFHENLNQEREVKLESLGLALNDLSEKIVPVEVEMIDLRDAPNYDEEALKIQRDEFEKLKSSVVQIEKSLDSLNDQLEEDWTSPSEEVLLQLVRVEQMRELLDEGKVRLKLLKNIFKEITKSEVVESELDSLHRELISFNYSKFGEKESLREEDLRKFEEALEEAQDHVMSLGAPLGEERLEGLSDKFEKNQLTLARLKSQATLNHENDRLERETRIESLALAAQDLGQEITSVEEKLGQFSVYFAPKHQSKELIQTKEELARVIEVRNQLDERLNSLVARLEDDKNSSPDDLILQREKLESLREALDQKSEELALLQSKSELFEPEEEAMEEDVVPEEGSSSHVIPPLVEGNQPKVEHQEEKDISASSYNNNPVVQENPSETKIENDALEKKLEPLTSQLLRLSISSVNFSNLPPEKEEAIKKAKMYLGWLMSDLAKIYPALGIKVDEPVENLQKELLGLRSKLLLASWNSLDISQLEPTILSSTVTLAGVWANSLADFIRDVLDNK